MVKNVVTWRQRSQARWTIAVSNLLIVAVVTIGGCRKSAVSQLRTSTPAEAAAQVLELYDGNKDGKLDSKELAASPALIDGLPRIDRDRDGAVTLAEMEARFGAHDQMSDVVAFQLHVKSKNVPLSGALVTFMPEPFMGEGKQSYVGTTDQGGACSLEGQEIKLPGVPTGYYKVHIVHQASGTDVTRGVEVADDTPAPNRLELDTQLATAPRSR
jgi:hypothetical protein